MNEIIIYTCPHCQADLTERVSFRDTKTYFCKECFKIFEKKIRTIRRPLYGN